MAEAQHVLVVDDEPDICRQIEEYFSEAGIRVTSVGDGQAMRSVAEAERIDLVLLDLQLPGEDGLTIARDFLAKTDIPFIMLTSRGEVMDRVVGLEIGAEDYVPKPFHLRELLARARTVLRRSERDAASAKVSVSAGTLRFAGWTLDVMARTLTSDDGRRESLTTQEFNEYVFCGVNTHSGGVSVPNEAHPLIKTHNQIPSIPFLGKFMVTYCKL